MSNYTYMVTNKINGKVYVGSHSWKGEGIDHNYFGSGTAITRAVKKYGKENFQVEVLYYYDTVEECRKDEERILTEYNVRDCPHSYNCKNSAIGMTSEDMTDEIRQKLSQANKGKTISDETRQKISQTLKGKTFSDETRKKLSQANKGKTFSEEHRKKLSQAHKGKRGKGTPNYGKKFSEEHRQKLSQAKNYKKVPVVAIDKNGKVKIFESIIECARKLNLHRGNIYQCLNGRQNHTGGYTFKYIEQLESGIYEGITE